MSDYIITDEQIAAAVETIHNIITHPDSMVSGEQLVWNALNKFSIEQCEGCGGSGRFEAVGLYEDCDECDGKGYVIKEVNDGT